MFARGTGGRDFLSWAKAGHLGRGGCTVAVCVHSSEHKSVSNRELGPHYLDAYRPDRLDDLPGLLHPDIEWTTTETWVER